MTARDVPDVVAWRRDAHVARWLGALDEPGLRTKYRARLATDHPVRCYLASVDDDRAGLMQCYRLAAFPAWEALFVAAPGSVGIDFFLGNPRWRDQRLSAPILRKFLLEVVFSDPAVPAAYAAPSQANLRSQRCLARVGFQKVAEVLPPGRSEPEVVMGIERATLWAMTQRSSQKPIPTARVLALDEFAALRPSIEGRIVCTSGGYDPIHPGHLSCLVASKAHGDVLVALVNGDSFLLDKKGRPFQDCDTRCRIVSYVRGVDFVIPFDNPGDPTVRDALRAVRPHVFTKGGDRTDASNIAEWDVCKELDIEIVTGVGLDKEWSSSNFLEDWGTWWAAHKNA